MVDIIEVLGYECGNCGVYFQVKQNAEECCEELCKGMDTLSQQSVEGKK